MLLQHPASCPHLSRHTAQESRQQAGKTEHNFVPVAHPCRVTCSKHRMHLVHEIQERQRKDCIEHLARITAQLWVLPWPTGQLCPKPHPVRTYEVHSLGPLHSWPHSETLWPAATPIINHNHQSATYCGLQHIWPAATPIHVLYLFAGYIYTLGSPVCQFRPIHLTHTTCRCTTAVP